MFAVQVGCGGGGAGSGKPEAAVGQERGGPNERREESSLGSPGEGYGSGSAGTVPGPLSPLSHGHCPHDLFRRGQILVPQAPSPSVTSHMTLPPTSHFLPLK